MVAVNRVHVILFYQHHSLIIIVSKILEYTDDLMSVTILYSGGYFTNIALRYTFFIFEIVVSAVRIVITKLCSLQLKSAKFRLIESSGWLG